MANAGVDVVLKGEFISNCSLISACALYAYDRCLTLWREVELIWSRKSASVATVLYLLMHLFLAVFLALEVAYSTITTCERLFAVYVGRVCFAMSFHLVYGAFTALRAYAIGYRSVWLACSIFFWSLPVVATEIYELIVSVPNTVPQPVGCAISTDGDKKLQSTLFLAGQATAIIPEILLIGAIWYHAMQVAAVKHIRQLFGLDTPFTTILIRDGSVYFVAALILLVINVVYSGVTAINTGILAPIVYSLQTILLSHFYVNLHEAFEARQAGMASEGTQLSELQFGTRLLGTLAGSLAYKDGSALAFADMENDLEWDSERGSKQEGVVELSVIGKSRAGQSSSLSPSSGGSRSFLDDTSTKKTA